MMRHTSFFATILLVLVGRSAAGSEFEPNHLFVADWTGGGVCEYDESHTLVRRFDAGGILAEPVGLAFGPDGLLYVGDALNQVVRIVDADGTLVETWAPGGLSGPRGLAFGPGGSLFVTSSGTGRVIELDSSGAVVREIGDGSGLAMPEFIAFAPDGHMLVTCFLTDLVYEFDPDGSLVRTFGGGELNDPTGIAFGPAGLLAVASRADHDVGSFGANGAQITAFSDATLARPNGVVFGPDFRLYVGSGDMDRLVMFLGNQYLGDFGGDDGVLFPFSLAFAPFRYKVKVNGIMTGGGQRQKVKGKGVLSIAPGSQTIMLDLQDDPDTPADYASLMGAERLVFHGLEGVASATERHRVLGGTEVKGPSYQDGVGSISLRVKGSLDEDGSYVPNRVKGWFHRSQGLQAVHLSMKVAKRLN